MSKTKERPYLDVNLPRDWKPFLQEALSNIKIQKQLEAIGYLQKCSSLGKWIIREFLIENTSFRFEHINTDDRHITIKDNKINRVFNIHIKEPEQLWCEFCDSIECEHVNYCLRIPEVRKVLEKKGWELPQLGER